MVAVSVHFPFLRHQVRQELASARMFLAQHAGRSQQTINYQADVTRYLNELDTRLRATAVELHVGPRPGAPYVRPGRPMGRGGGGGGMRPQIPGGPPSVVAARPFQGGPRGPVVGPGRGAVAVRPPPAAMQRGARPAGPGKY